MPVERRLDIEPVDDELGSLVSIGDRLAELDELIQEIVSQIEAIRGREKGVPLQMGCALFSLFVMAIIVITIFMPLGREYFGGWLFYIALALALVFGFMRVRRRFADPQQLEEMRQDRARLESALEELVSSRASLIELKQKIASREGEPPIDGNGG